MFDFTAEQGETPGTEVIIQTKNFRISRGQHTNSKKTLVSYRIPRGSLWLTKPLSHNF